MRSRPAAMLLVASLVASICYLYEIVDRANHQPHERTDDYLISEWIMLAGFSFAVVPLVLRFSRSGAAQAISQSFSSLVVVVTGALLFAILSIHNGFEQFGAYDCSGLLQLTWSVHSGLIPYHDFPSTYPPLAYLGALLATKLFGFTWGAFVYGNACLGVLVYALTFYCLRQVGLGVYQAVASALLPLFLSMLLIGYWWWNPLASIAVVLTLSSCLAAGYRSQRLWDWMIVSFSVFFLMLNKPNAWVVGLCYGILLVRSRSHAWKTILAVLAGATAAQACCRAFGFSFTGVLNGYQSIASTRGDPFSFTVFQEYGARLAESYCAGTVGVLLILMCVYATFRQFWKRSEFPLSPTLGTAIFFHGCCWAGILAGLSLAFTNFENKLIDMAPIAFVAAVLYSARQPKPAANRAGPFLSMGRRSLMAAVFCFCIAASCYWGMTRLRVRTTGFGMFYDPSASVRIGTGFFRGLLTTPRQVQTDNEIAQVLKQEGKDKVFFGPRLEYAYAGFNVPIGKGLPIFWHPGSAFAVEARPVIEQQFFDNRFTTLIFMKGDYTFMSPQLLGRIFAVYTKSSAWPLLDVYTLKPPPGLHTEVSGFSSNRQM